MLQCDESGLCEIADRIRSGFEDVERLFDVRDQWATLVDIAPLNVGHCLLLPYRHVNRAALLGERRFLDYGDYIDQMIARLVQFGVGLTVAVEHGSGNERSTTSCVRHCHTHVCPIQHGLDETDAFIRVIGKYVEICSISKTWRRAFRAVSRLDEYVLVRSGTSILTGRPYPGIRQISRVLLAALNGRVEQGSIDWVLETENEKYFRTLDIINRERLKVVV
jgi:diadenosine tetraphosphate (Ap4A) HIT family hydrolase